MRDVVDLVVMKMIMGRVRGVEANLMWCIFWMSMLVIFAYGLHTMVGVSVCIMVSIAKLTFSIKEIAEKVQEVQAQRLQSISHGSESPKHYGYSDDIYHYYDDDDDQGYDDLNDDDVDESQSRTRTYYDSSGTYVGYRDEAGWFHGEGGHNYMGYMDDDGSFYDGSGMYRGQVEDGGLIWEHGKGYTGFHEGGRFSEEGHYGVPDIYEDGGDGTGGAFDSMIDDDDD